MNEAHPAGPVEVNGSAPFLKSVLLKLHQALCCSEHRDESRGQSGEAPRRTLYPVHQLQESRHAAEGEAVVRHAQGCPEKSHQITHGKAQVDHQIAEHGKERSAHHALTKLALCGLQPPHHRLFALQCLDEHAVLNGLLEHALHLGIRRTDGAREVAHPANVDLAGGYEHRNDAHCDERQAGIHDEKIAESTHEQREHGERVGNGLGEKAHHIVHVYLQTVEHIAGVVLLFAVPLGSQDAVEHVLLHAVLCTDAKNIAHPHTGDIECKIKQNKAAHQGHGPVDGARHHARSHIDGVLHRPHLGQRHPHRGLTYKGIEHGLQPIAAPGPPQPAQNAAGRVLVGARHQPAQPSQGVLSKELHTRVLSRVSGGYPRWSAPHISFSRSVEK